VTCDYPPRQCLDWHYTPHLAQVKLSTNGLQLQARCPACDRRSLTMSAGQHKRFVRHCHAGCDGREVRRALTVAGVPSGCLPRGDGTEHSRTDIVAAILTSSTRQDRATTILCAYAVLQGHTRWPKGRALESLAADVGLSRRAAYDARQAGPLLPPLTTSTTAPGRRAVKESQVTAARRPRAVVQPTAHEKVQPTAQPGSLPGAHARTVGSTTEAARRRAL
jgi:hypothetical protein